MNKNILNNEKKELFLYYIFSKKYLKNPIPEKLIKNYLENSDNILEIQDFIEMNIKPEYRKELLIDVFDLIEASVETWKNSSFDIKKEIKNYCDSQEDCDICFEAEQGNILPNEFLNIDYPCITNIKEKIT